MPPTTGTFHADDTPYIIAIAASYGIAMEAGQHFLPHRTPFLISDAFINTIGASGVLCWYLVRPYFELHPLTTFLSKSDGS